MSEISRREILQSLAAVVAASGTLTTAAAQSVHHAVAVSTPVNGLYAPKALNAHEYRTLVRLAELIIPADEKSPSAADAGAPAFIDFLASQNADLLAIYTGGIAWLDAYTQRKNGVDFVDAAADRQTAVLDLIAFRKNDGPELAAGIRFFDWVRKMVVDAFYTSPAGVQDVGYIGNTAVSEFRVPQEAVDYAFERSPFRR